MESKSRKAEQSEATRKALVAVARELFATRGYADTATEEVVRRAGVTRGALYHHFRDKADLFAAVLEELEQEFAQNVATASLAQTGGIWDQMRAGFQAFLDVCLVPEVQRIVLLDGPAVLGWRAFRDIDAKYGLGMIQTTLRAAMEAGVLERQPVEPLSHLLLSALQEAGMYIASADDVQAARREVGSAIERLLEGLRCERA